MSSLFGACSKDDCDCMHYDEVSERLCDCGHKRCFHAPLSASSTRRIGQKSVSDLVAPIFELEVNRHLTENFSRSLSECGLSDFRTREVDENDEVLVEIDSFGYISHDSLQYGVPSPRDGISLIIPLDCNGVEVIAAPPMKLSHSPGAKDKSLEETVEKYVIGETYSGQNESKIKGKVVELELKIARMVERFKRQNTGYVYAGDVTSVVGAALLAFSCGPMNRKDATNKFSGYVSRKVAEKSTPNLWRLAQARRLYLVVLSATDSAYSTSHRELSQQNQELSLGQQELGIEISKVLGAIEELKSDKTKK